MQARPQDYLIHLCSQSTKANSTFCCCYGVDALYKLTFYLLAYREKTQTCGVIIGVSGTGARVPSTSKCLIFQVTSEPHKLWHSTRSGCINNSKTTGVAYSAYSVTSAPQLLSPNFLIFMCVTLILFYPSFVPPPSHQILATPLGAVVQDGRGVDPEKK